jgi:hypothetical protein
VPPPTAAAPAAALGEPIPAQPAAPRSPPRRRDKPARPIVAPPSAAVPARPAARADSRTLEELLERPRSADPAASAPAPKPAPPDASAPAAEAPRASDELHDVARARSLLRSDPPAALELLNRVAREHPHGYFVEERSALTILALLGANRRDLAESRAASFLQAYPNSPFADRVRAAVSR